MIEETTTHTVRKTVESGDTAATHGSGSLDVLATPAMIALMENAAMTAVQSSLPEGSTTVGVAIEVAHTRATPLGAEVSATATLVEARGRELRFTIVAADGLGEIGRGTHTRVVVDVDRFLARLPRP